MTDDGTADPEFAAEQDALAEGAQGEGTLDERVPGEIAPGDLVVIPYERVRTQLGCAPEVALVLEDRRHVVKVYLPGMDRMFWLERDVLEVVADGRLPTHPLIARLHRACHRVNGEMIELYDGTMRNGMVFLFSRGMGFDDAEAVVEIFDGMLDGFWIEPANMRLTRLRLKLRESPEVAP